MKCREFQMVGNDVPELENEGLFLQEMERAILRSLEKRELITHMELLQCEKSLGEKRQNRHVNQSL